MTILQRELSGRREQLEDYIQKAEEFLKGVPVGKIIVNKCRGTYQYYRQKDGEREYLSKKMKSKLIEGLCQKEYDIQLLKYAREEKNKIDQLLKCYKEEFPEKIKNGLHMGAYDFCVPYEMTKEEFLRQWQNQNYEKKRVDVEDQDAIFTEQGEKVRSKSEKIIADKLYAMKIPYYYEKPLFFKAVGFIYPDFTILNLNERKEMYWEHFGMMGDDVYSKNAIRKMESYIRNELYPGIHTIFTFETKEHPLNSKIVEKMICRYLK